MKNYNYKSIDKKMHVALETRFHCKSIVRI